jgi:hypothetical protein
VLDVEAELWILADSPKPKNEVIMPQTMVNGRRTSENISDAYRVTLPDEVELEDVVGK